MGKFKVNKILLAGNPNAGKSAIFNPLTEPNVIVSNYPGTTAEWIKGSVRIEGKIYELTNTPGTGYVPYESETLFLM